MIDKKTWKDFKDSGLLWFINTTLHLFGWVIVFEVDEDGIISEVYPARTNFRGFPAEVNDDGYIKLTNHLSDIISELKNDIKEEN
jgi:hypothetical protein